MQLRILQALNKWQRRDFTYGDADCCQFAGFIVKELTGKDYLADFNYSSEEEAYEIKDALEMYEARLKAVSFLKYQETGYKQAPYEPITKEEYEEMIKGVTPIQKIETNEGGVGSKYCSNDTCEI